MPGNKLRAGAVLIYWGTCGWFVFNSLRCKRAKVARWFAFALLSGLIALLPGQAFAISDPDSIMISDVRAYDSVLESGDLLVIVEYDLPYTSIPTETIGDAYLGRFLRSTAELNSVEPFSYNDKGYGVGAFSLYWSATQRTTDSIEFDDTNSEAYAITLQGKIGVFTGSVPTTTTTTITWQDVSDTKDLLKQHIVELAQRFEADPDWNDGTQSNIINTASTNFGNLISVTTGNDQLTAVGEEYFSNAIPQLQVMVPSMFSSGVTTPDFTERSFDTSFEGNINSFWDGNWVDTRFQNLANTYRVPKRTLTTILALFFMCLIAWFVAKLLDNTDNGMAFGLLTFAVTLPMAAAVNWVPMAVVAAVGFICLTGVSWSIWGRRSGT